MHYIVPYEISYTHTPKVKLQQQQQQQQPKNFNSAAATKVTVVVFVSHLQKFIVSVRAHFDLYKFSGLNVQHIQYTGTILVGRLIWRLSHLHKNHLNGIQHWIYVFVSAIVEKMRRYIAILK